MAGFFDKLKAKFKGEPEKTEPAEQAKTQTTETKPDPQSENGQTACNPFTAWKESGELDDVTYIGDIQHYEYGPWHQYDILLLARGYGWDTMINWADYMIGAGFGVQEVTVAPLGGKEANITEAFHKNGDKCKGLAELEEEQSSLSIAGASIVLASPTKIVWLNQTRVLRIFTLFNNTEKVRRYAESMVRRNFGTKDAMKLGKPVPKEN